MSGRPVESRAAVERAYSRWLAAAAPGTAERAELEALAAEPAALEEAFCCDLHFGTGGLRAKMGQGSNRLNARTVARATQGVADWLSADVAQGQAAPKAERLTVLLCRDSRDGGEEFARAAAEVLAGNGIRALVFPCVEPTPVLSFGVRHAGCTAGVVITASHNPREYNGYKVYGADGCQITVADARAIQARIDATDPFEGVSRMPFDKAMAAGLVVWAPSTLVDAYVAAVLGERVGVDCSALRVAYTPLNGTGLACVRRVLAGVGVGALEVPAEQAEPDGSFFTCPKPNPEVPQAMERVVGLAAATGADLALATDPDADRLGVAVRRALPGGEACYHMLTGNEVGLLLLDWAAERAGEGGCPLGRRVAVTTVVTAPMADDIARARGFELRRTLTGFKFVGEQVGLLEAEGRADDFLLGIEESLGYLKGTYARDKDGVEAAMLVCELAAWWRRERGLDLVEAMEALYEAYGWWSDRQVTRAFEGADGAARMAAVMRGLRQRTPEALAGLAVVGATDFLPGAAMPAVNAPAGSAAQALPPSDVLQWDLAGGSRVLVRPSGTEPKLKAYIFARASERAEAERLCDALAAAVEERVRA